MHGSAAASKDTEIMEKLKTKTESVLRMTLTHDKLQEVITSSQDPQSASLRKRRGSLLLSGSTVEAGVSPLDAFTQLTMGAMQRNRAQSDMMTRTRSNVQRQISNNFSYLEEIEEELNKAKEGGDADKLKLRTQRSKTKATDGHQAIIHIKEMDSSNDTVSEDDESAEADNEISLTEQTVEETKDGVTKLDDQIAISARERSG